MGRHSTPGEDDDIDVPLAELGTRGDLQLLREHPAIRARCIAAALVPFALYTIAMIAAGAARNFAVWVWVPIVVAGICVGLTLDLGFRALKRERDEEIYDGQHALAADVTDSDGATTGTGATVTGSSGTGAGGTVPGQPGAAGA
jgi:hypothetical protein